ncbi:MAG: electron transfer flavoprotein subunit beta [Legionellales bacterium RIFCSPHIGHO2_12_FULL_35_11]|nr:MAG: electron transfer flavoprotein subunit beta [Legionellales bacterium RIFCSPHIGHO2_12_FULL_35_11]
MSVLVIVEHDNKIMNPSTRCVVQAALQIDKNPILLVAGYKCDSVVKEAVDLLGVESVWFADEECYAFNLAEPLAKLVGKVAESFSHILVSSSTFGKNILPRAAAILDITQITDVTEIIDSNTFLHPIYAGNAIEKVRVLDEKKALTIRASAFDAVGNKESACGVEKLAYTFENTHSKFIGQEVHKSVRPELNGADIVVSGGRGLQSIDKFKLVEELADCLGAAVGASRAAVDAGFAPNDYQVGQTGKIVAPNLYIALGISGAVQHLAGMKDSKVIVAVNSDEDAPIFQIATYGLVGDLFDFIPAFISELKTRGLAKC